MARRSAVGWIVAGLFVFAAGCDTRPSAIIEQAPAITTPLCDELQAAATPADMRRGAEVWELLCTGCHGERGAGGTSAGIHTADLTDRRRWASRSDTDRLRAISEGIEGTPMLGWSAVLVESEITAVYRHLCTLVGDEQGRP